jgi:RND superfamily putative drug exporter
MALARIARWSYRRRWMVLALWMVALIGINVVGKAVGNDFKDKFGGGKTDSAQAFGLLKTKFPARAGDTADIVYRANQGVADPAVQAALTGLFTQVKTEPHVIGIDAPRVSADGTTAFATVQYDRELVDLPNNTAKPLMAAVKAMPKPGGLQVELGGDVVARAIQQQPGGTEAIGLLAAIVILFLAFGSFMAMGLPVLTAVFGVGVGAVFVTLLSHVLVMPSFAPQLAFMIGLGVGIDYALFIVTRYRAGLHDGLDPEGATVLAITTSGRAVLFAGCTVIIALLGMFLMGVSFIYGLALSASMAVLMVMLASVTLLPAILGFAGLKLAGKEKHRRSHRETVAYRWSREVQRHPLSLALLSLGVLVVIALPLFSIHLGSSDHGNDPKKLTTRKAYDLLAQGFGAGSNGPVIVAAELPAAGVATAFKLQGTIINDKDVAFVVPPRLNQAGDAAVLVVIPKGSPQDRSTEQLVHRLRHEIVPSVTAGTGVVAHVGGITAGYIDSGDRIGQRLVLVIGAVILLSFLLLMAVFRSVLVAVKAAIMNMLSIGAAYGVIVAIFQWGWLGKVFGVSRTGPIESWVPLMLFTIVFGLSMDYEVFLLSRVREEYLVTGDNAQAVADGLAATARVITAAAAIMVCVFSSFVLGDVRVLKLFGLGLASAVFMDATIVRMVLVPSTMELLGKANWWFPHWLDRVVPHISVEAAPEERELVAAGAD